MLPEGADRRVRWGILGCGRVAGNAMAPGIRRSINGDLLAVASRSTEKATEFAQRLGCPRAYGSYDDLLRDQDVEAVYIALPNSLHREWTIRAAEAGKHVLCEKPLAGNGEEAREMVEACQRSGVLLMEAFAHRFQPQNLEVRRLVRDGRIGQVLGMTAIHVSPRRLPGDVRLSKELAGGALMDVGCYCVNTARFILDSEPTSVFAHAEFGQQSQVDERMAVMMEFPGGQFVQFACGFKLSPDSYYQSYDVIGASGRIHVPRGFAQVQTFRRGEIVDSCFTISDPGGSEERTFPGVHQWQLEAEYFAGCILQGTGVGFPAENGLANMRVVEAIQRSARENRLVAVDVQLKEVGWAP